mgnify:CR=1 FL=1
MTAAAMVTTLVLAMVPTVLASAMASDTEVATATAMVVDSKITLAAARAMATGKALLVEWDIPCILLVKLFMCLVQSFN